MSSKFKHAIKRKVAKMMRRMIRWYREGSSGDYSQKYQHYLLDKSGKLTIAKKKKILSDIWVIPSIGTIRRPLMKRSCG